jgi:hypothetical protein
MGKWGQVAMRRNAGLAFTLLWIVSVALLLAAVTAWSSAGSPYGALSFLTAGLLLSPAGQRVVGNLAHPLLPPRLAFLSFITLLPLGLLLVSIDVVARLDVDARKRGFASAGEMARAKDLGLATQAALAAHDEARQRAAIEQRCKTQVAKPPLDCHPPGHRNAALAYVRSMLDQGAYEQIVKEAIGQQRAQFLSADKRCTPLVDRIDEEALPHLVASKAAGIELAASLWARHLPQSDLERLVERAKPGTSYMRTGTTDPLEEQVASLNKRLDREYDAELQAWARRLVSEETSWRAFISGRMSADTCKPAMDLARR